MSDGGSLKFLLDFGAKMDNSSSWVSENLVRLSGHDFNSFDDADSAINEAANQDGCKLKIRTNNDGRNTSTSYITRVSAGHYQMYGHRSESDKNLIQQKKDEKNQKAREDPKCKPVFSKTSYSRTCDCNFKAKITPLLSTTPRVFRFEVYSSRHNNHPAVCPSIFPENRKFDPTLKALAIVLIEQNVSSSQVLNSLRSYSPECLLQKEDIDNLRNAHKKETTGDLTPTQHMIYTALLNDYKMRIELDKEKSENITHFFCMSPIAIFLWMLFNIVLVEDTTYNTNKQGQYLHEGVGISSPGNSFLVFTAFTLGQTTEDFIWLHQAPCPSAFFLSF
jgi:hypothetical protein